MGFFKKTKEELDPNEILPFCTRCFQCGITCEEEGSNFCHMCGSEGTCVPMKRHYVKYLWENLDAKIEQSIRYGRKLEREGK